jgi:hypothetical protein
MLAWDAMAQAPHAPLDPMVQGATRCVHACGVQGTALLPSASGFSNLMRSMSCGCRHSEDDGGLLAQNKLLMMCNDLR